MLNVLDICAGIGGFTLGFEMSGAPFRTVAFCEIDPYAQAVLRKNYPDVPIIDDVSRLTRDALDALSVGRVDVVTAGFPCQDVSLAGKRRGLIGGDRSNIFFEIARVIGEVKPRYVVLENVRALCSDGLGLVLSVLDSLGYDAEWHCIPASAVGAWHRRDRVWIIAYARSIEHESGSDAIRWPGAAQLPNANADSAAVRDEPGRRSGADGAGARVASDHGFSRGRDADRSGERAHVADAEGERQRKPADKADAITACGKTRDEPFDGGSPVADGVSSGLQRHAGNGENCGGQKSHRPTREEGLRCGANPAEGWLVEPDVGRVVARLSSALDGDRIADADYSQGATGEILRALRGDADARPVRWSSRGLRALSAKEILLAPVRQFSQAPEELGNLSLPRKEASEGSMRGVWYCEKSAGPSCRRAAREQRTVEHPDALRLVSQLLACNCKSTWLDRAGSAGVANRTARLKCLGNAVVPQIPALIAQAIWLDWVTR